MDYRSLEPNTFARHLEAAWHSQANAQNVIPEDWLYTSSTPMNILPNASVDNPQGSSSSFEQHLVKSWHEHAAKPVVTASFLQETLNAAAAEDEDDFVAWSNLLSRPDNNVYEPVKDILARHPVPEKKLRRLRSAAKIVGNLALNALARTEERLYELRTSPHVQRNVGRLAAGALSAVLLAGAAHNIIDRQASSARRASTIAGQAMGIPQAEFATSNGTVAVIETTPTTTAPLDLSTIFQQTMAENARLAELRAQEKAAAEAKAEAAAQPKAATTRAAAVAEVSSDDCEQYRPLVEKYPWPVDQAMLTMEKESGCDANAVSDTDDHGLFQLNGIQEYDPATNVRIAFRKWKEGRVGEENFSAWYAVCTEGNNPQPKYTGIDCQ